MTCDATKLCITGSKGVETLIKLITIAYLNIPQKISNFDFSSFRFRCIAAPGAAHYERSHRRRGRDDQDIPHRNGS